VGTFSVVCKPNSNKFEGSMLAGMGLGFTQFEG